jgi:hypothetical protein
VIGHSVRTGLGFKRIPEIQHAKHGKQNAEEDPPRPFGTSTRKSMRPTPDRKRDNNQSSREENASVCLSGRRQPKNDGAKASSPGNEAEKIFLQPRQPGLHQLQNQFTRSEAHDKREPGSKQYAEKLPHPRRASLRLA